MALEIVRRIRGNLHGSIDISILEDAAIAHPIFQRLRRIHQTAFLSYIFPGATHTRFEHSLGVLHMAKVAWQKLHSNQERLAISTRKIEDFGKKEEQKAFNSHGKLSPTFAVMNDIFNSDYIFQALRLAAMLHDIGHPAFSHSGERFLPTYAKVLAENPQLPAYLKDYLKENPANQRVSHETFTLLLVEKLLTEVYATHQIQLKVDPRDVIAIINTSITPVENSPLLKFKVLKLCHEIVSGEFDVDRMDYLRRDSKESGVIYGIFDADRILDSLSLYADNQNDLHLAIQYSGLAAFEDYLRARQSMYLQLYFHKTSVAAEATLQHIIKKIGNITFPAKLDEYLEVDEFNVFHFLREEINKTSKTEDEKSEIVLELKNLLFHRKLWKRIFELSGSSNAVKHNPDMDIAKAALNKLQIPWEQISSKSNLTNFRPRDLDQASDNYLRLIKKDIYQIPRVVPIEDHSSLISEKHTVHISRLYIQDKIMSHGQLQSKVASKAIHDALEQRK